MERITLRALKYDRRPHFEWPSEIVADSPNFVVTLAPPGTTCFHHSKAMEIQLQHFSLSIFLPGDWWNAMLDFDADGRSLEAYCNIAMPFTRGNERLEWIDLDLDVTCTPDRTPQMVDEEEFEANAKLYGYPGDVIEIAWRTAHDLLQRAVRHEFPFQFLELHELLRNFSSDTPSRLANRER